MFNRFETGLDWIGVVAREENCVLWHFELRDDGEVIEKLPLPKPVSPAADRVLRPTKPAVEETHDKKSK